MAIPTPIVRELNETGILRTMAIDLSENVEDRAAIIEVLRSKLYSDKTLAPIREYATNAMDSHVEAGIPGEPIVVTLPTAISPELHIRDFGIGLTPDEIEKIYCRYGRSTKRNTNAQTGQLGLGCKSAFAYGDSFMVVSYKEGVKTTYNLTISGVCSAIVAEPMTDEDRNGIEVIVPVNQNDVRTFQDKAINFFK
jgi:DNA topoisomerase VI subunit B